MMQRILLSLFMFISSYALADESADGAEEKASWDVSSDQYYTQEINIDTSTTTWSNVTVSHDGKTLVFDMLGDIYSVPISGGEATALTSGIEWNYQPRFSPDGSQIAFVSDRAGGDNLWIMNADGSDAQAVTDEAEHLVHNPAWSPDGNYLVGRKGYYSTRSIPAGEIWMFHHGGGNGVNLVKRMQKKTRKTARSPPSLPMANMSTTVPISRQEQSGSTTKTRSIACLQSNDWNWPPARPAPWSVAPVAQSALLLHPMENHWPI